MHFFDHLKSFDIILASKSARRYELLASAGIPFRVLYKDTSEEYHDGLPPKEVALMLAYRKVQAFSNELLNEKTIVIAADTIVVFREKILNKPEGCEHAKEMLSLLSGNTHQVITGVCIGHKTNFRCFHETTSVSFRKLSEQEIDYYLSKYRPYDKAGSYGIQEWIGLIGVSRIEGSYTNVVGLPVERVFEELKRLVAAQNTAT